MDLNATIDFIIKDLNEAREIIDDLKRYPGVPELQIELAKSKCKSASEIIALFKSLQPSIKPSDNLKHTVSKEMIVEKPLPENETPEPIKVEIISEKEIREAVVTNIREVPDALKEPPATARKKTTESIIADQFSNRPESFNEKIGSHKHEDDVLEILRTKPLSSLDEAIGINDKFLFIREIFDGNTELYHQAIQKLESVGNLPDAIAFIMSYSGDNTGNEAVKQLIDLVKRKFLTHE